MSEGGQQLANGLSELGIIQFGGSEVQDRVADLLKAMSSHAPHQFERLRSAIRGHRETFDGTVGLQHDASQVLLECVVQVPGNSGPFLTNAFTLHAGGEEVGSLAHFVTQQCHPDQSQQSQDANTPSQPSHTFDGPPSGEAQDVHIGWTRHQERE